MYQTDYRSIKTNRLLVYFHNGKPPLIRIAHVFAWILMLADLNRKM